MRLLKLIHMFRHSIMIFVNGPDVFLGMAVIVVLLVVFKSFITVTISVVPAIE